MVRAIEARIDKNGSIQLTKPITLRLSQRVIVLILDDLPRASDDENALLSELALAEDWNRPEEDAAWQHLQSVQ